jgi:XTP/dITP diphosphohydrolase
MIINYVTSSSFKIEENKVFLKNCKLSDNTPISTNFEFRLHSLNIAEILEIDLVKMVKCEVKEAYSRLKIPCIVEHAGLIFEKYKAVNYPGGLTKPLWNAFNSDFLVETNSSNQRAIAKAVVAYCDGRNIFTFIGETEGVLSAELKGSRNFYWDTVFIPDGSGGLTYSEIVDQHGLDEKITKYSQSTKAMINFLDYIKSQPNDEFWRY